MPPPNVTCEVISVRIWHDKGNSTPTFPVVIFLVSKVISVKPSGPFPTSHMTVSNASPGFTGVVNRTYGDINKAVPDGATAPHTPNNFSDLGSPLPTVAMTARAAKPKVDNPWRMTPSKPTF